MSKENGLPSGWVQTTLGDVLPIQYGKGLVEAIRDPNGQVPVYGSSGIVGSHNHALTSKAALIIGRKGSIGSVHYSPVSCWPIDTTYFVEESASINLKFFLYLPHSAVRASIFCKIACSGDCHRRALIYLYSIKWPATQVCQKHCGMWVSPHFSQIEST